MFSRNIFTKTFLDDTFWVSLPYKCHRRIKEHLPFPGGAVYIIDEAEREGFPEGFVLIQFCTATVSRLCLRQMLHQ